MNLHWMNLHIYHTSSPKDLGWTFLVSLSVLFVEYAFEPQKCACCIPVDRLQFSWKRHPQQQGVMWIGVIMLVWNMSTQWKASAERKWAGSVVFKMRTFITGKILRVPLLELLTPEIISSESRWVWPISACLDLGWMCFVRSKCFGIDSDKSRLHANPIWVFSIRELPSGNFLNILARATPPNHGHQNRPEVFRTPVEDGRTPTPNTFSMFDHFSPWSQVSFLIVCVLAAEGKIVIPNKTTPAKSTRDQIVTGDVAWK